MSSNKKTQQVVWLAALAAMGVFIFWGAPALADGGPRADFPEVEPNDAKATANPVYPLMSGDTITGTSTASSGVGLDYFRVKTGPLPPSIYRHRLTITTPGTAGHTGTIRGLTQSAGVINPTSDATYQTSSTSTTPPRFNQWYGFGREEEIYYRVTGSTSTTAPYVATLTTEPVTVTLVPGVFLPGTITITTYGQGHTTDTDLWVYDGSFNAIVDYGNDDAYLQSYSQSTLTRDYLPGFYYLGVTNYNFANNLPSPPDDDYRNGIVLDFPDAAANSSTTVAISVSFSITDSTGVPVAVASTKTGPFDVNWFRFEVLTPEVGACCVGPDCLVATPEECLTLGGEFKGLGYPCTPNPCVGACCFPDGHCELVLPQDCLGIYWGDGTVCDPNPCPQPGACCRVDGSCYMSTITTPGDCVAGDTYLGDSTNCDPNPCPQPNDDCPGAIAATDGTPAATGNNCAASAIDWAEASCQSNSNKDMWYTYTATCTGTVTMSTENSAQSDTVLSVYTGDCAAPMTEIACNDDGGEVPPLSALLSFQGTFGATYLVRVASYSTGCGGYNLNITCAPSLGACCDDATGVCQDDIAEHLCQPPMRFVAGTLCVDLVPPCLPPPCEPDPTGTYCPPVPCPDPNEVCLPKKIKHNLPDLVFPPGGIDQLTPTSGYLVILGPGGETMTYTIEGEPNLTTVVRGDPYLVLDHREIEMTMTALELHAIGGGGGGGALVHLNPMLPSPGRVVGAPLPGPDFPAESFFDVFVQIDLPDVGAIGLWHTAPIPLHASGITSIPPWDSPFETPAGWPGVELLDQFGNPTGYQIIQVIHIPPPPPPPPPPWEVIECECMDPEYCHIEPDLAGGAPYCAGGCPPGQECRQFVTVDPFGDEVWECQCVDQPVCEPDPTGTYCPPVVCPDPTEVCLPKKVKHNLPDIFFPPGGEDVILNTFGQLTVLHVPSGGVETYLIVENVPNLTRVLREEAMDFGDHREVAMEMVELNLVGTSRNRDILIRESPSRVSHGRNIGALAATTDYPADSFFDVFVEIDIPDLGALGLYNDLPIRLDAPGIMRVPPLGSTYRTPLAWPGVELFNPDGTSSEYRLIEVIHGLPPFDPPPEWQIIDCECIDPDYCHIQLDVGAFPYCVGGCPPGEDCLQIVTTDPFGDEIWECVCIPRCPLWGDVNGDGVVDLNDVDCFVGCLLEVAPPVCICPCADMNLDGVLNGLDIQPFVDALIAP